MLPNATGGANWQGGSFDPETGMLYIFSNTQVSRARSRPGCRERSDMALRPRARRRTPGQRPKATGAVRRPHSTVQGLPLVKPPYGRITAIDLNKGEIVWQIAHGETPDNIRNHPALQGPDDSAHRPAAAGSARWSRRRWSIAGEGGFFTLPDGRRGAMLRAYDKATGAEVGAVYMPAPQTGSPMTYMLNGKQYIVVAISGQGFPGELIAFRLPAAP